MNTTLFVPADAGALAIVDASYSPYPPDQPTYELTPVEGYFSIRREGPNFVGGLSLSLTADDPAGTLHTLAGSFEVPVPSS